MYGSCSTSQTAACTFQNCAGCGSASSEIQKACPPRCCSRLVKRMPAARETITTLQLAWQQNQGMAWQTTRAGQVRKKGFEKKGKGSATGQKKAFRCRQQGLFGNNTRTWRHNKGLATEQKGSAEATLGKQEPGGLSSNRTMTRLW